MVDVPFKRANGPTPRSLLIIALHSPAASYPKGRPLFLDQAVATYWIEFDGVGNFQVWTQVSDDAPSHICVTFPRYFEAKDWINARVDLEEGDPA
jgi:hypothetical protein